MLRKSVVILAMLLCSAVTQVYALGLGTVSVESALNQPLRVRIEILQLGTTRLQDVTVQLASADDFQRFNVERVGFLSDIRFSIAATDQGNFVTLTSSQIVREPYLNFILETRWPNGRLLSEHTILLDLPVFDDQQPSANVRQPISPVLQRPDGVAPATQPFVEPAAPAVTPPAQSVVPVLEPEIIEQPAVAPLAPEPEEEILEPEVLPTELAEETAEEPAVVESVEEAAPLVEQEVAEAAPEPVPVEAPAEPEPVAEEIAASEEPAAAEVLDEPETIETSATDTLSDIALRVRPNNAVSIQQTMLALQELNPDAFTDGNINQLRSGQVLRVPSLAQIEAINPQDAIDEVARQNQQSAAVDVQPLAAPATAEPAQVAEPQGQLSVVTAEPDAIDASAGASELNSEENAEFNRRIAELENQLALRQEEADRARIVREELELRMTLLESQIADAQEIIRLQDLQLAQLQESLAEAAAQAEAEAARAAAITAAEAEAAEPVSGPSGILDDVMRILTGNTLMMLFGIGLVILLLVVLLLRRNKASKLEDESLDELAEKEFPGDAGEETGADRESALADDAALDSELDDILGADDAAADSAEVAQKDALNAQVDAFIAADQPEAAAELLQSELETDPDNHELRLKLLGVVALQGDLAAFNSHADILAAEMSPVIDRQVARLREQFADEETETAVIDTPATADTGEIEFEAPAPAPKPKQAESASFLDDLGIDLDAFDDDSFEFGEEAGKGPEESARDKEPEKKAAAVVEEKAKDLEFEDPEAMDLTFDLGEGDSVADEAASDAVTLDELIDEEEPADDEKPAEPEELDALEFEAEVATTANKAEADQTAEKLDLETFAFETDDAAADKPAEVESAEEEVKSDEADEHVLDFDFDKAEINPEAKAEKEPEEELETFDFDLDANTVVDKAADEGAAIPAIEEVSFDIDEADAEDNDDEEESRDLAPSVEEVDELEGDIDFDLDEFDVEVESATVKETATAAAETEVEIADDDEDFFDLDAEAAAANTGKTKEVEQEDEIDLGAGVDIEAEEPVEEPVDDEVEDLDDLEFLSDEDEVEIESVGEVEEVLMLSDDEETATKLELAYAYQKMGDSEGAKEILEEVIKEGSDVQVKEARDLLASLDKPSD
ncbi:MAG: hypothetical protein O2971_04985 [Proteobacteria bacterium]|nr:hypothetical protein [Pseudomonadota bacterium]